MAEMGRTWFWRSLRWFAAALLVAPLAALVLGVGVQISEGVVSGAGHGTAQAVGTAVIGCLLILVGAICPLVLFRLLAFVDPGTSSGAAMRTSLAAQGGLTGLLSGKASASGAAAGSAASQRDSAGRSTGEATADAATSSRFASATRGVGGLVGGAMAGVGNLAQSAVDLGSDVLSSSGVGHQHPYYPQYYPNRPSDEAAATAGSRGAADPGRTPEPPDDASGGAVPDPPAMPPAGPKAPATPRPPTVPNTDSGGGPAAAGESGAAAAAL
jgi:hypothetical protein